MQRAQRAAAVRGPDARKRDREEREREREREKERAKFVDNQQVTEVR